MLHSMRKLHSVRALLFLAACMLVPMQPTLANDGESAFNDSVVIKHGDEQHRLFLTGETVRKKFFLDIYAMAHYLESRPAIINENIYQEILEAGGTKQISMVFQRDLRAEQIRDSLLKGLKSNSNKDEFLSIEPDIQAFMQAINQDVQANEEFTVRWLPNDNIESFYQGERISSIQNRLFAKTLWSIWFSNKSVIDREKLVKNLLTSS